MAAGDDLLLTRAEAAERLRISVQTVCRLTESGHLAEVQVSAREMPARAGMAVGAPPLCPALLGW